MFFLCLATLFFGQYVVSISTLSDEKTSSIHPGDTLLVIPTRRSMFDIVWSCLLTLFLCTWTTVHPNIPPPNEGVLQGVWRRIKLMLWTLLVPELILIWAVKQWLAAGYIAGMFKDHKWTRVHGHFLGMGGFTLINNSKLPAILRLPEMPKLPQSLRKPMDQNVELQKEGEGEEDVVDEELPLNAEPWIRDEEQRFHGIEQRFEQEQRRYRDQRQWDEDLQREEQLLCQVEERLRKDALPRKVSGMKDKTKPLRPIGVNVLLLDRRQGLQEWEQDVCHREEELQRLDSLVRRREEEPSPLDLLRRSEQELQNLKVLMDRKTDELRLLKVKVQRRKEEVLRMEGLLKRKDERDKVKRTSVGLQWAEELVRHLQEKKPRPLEQRNLEVVRQYEELQRWAHGEEPEQFRPWEGPQQEREELDLRWNELLRKWEELLQLRKEEQKRHRDVELADHDKELRRISDDLQSYYQRLRFTLAEEQQPDESPLIHRQQLWQLKHLKHYKKLQFDYEHLAGRINDEFHSLNQEPLMSYDEQRRFFEETWGRYQEDSSRYIHSQLDVNYYDEAPGTLTTERFRDLALASKIVFPTITAAEIKDKSKADFMAKTVAILQTTWFIVQCIVRGIQHLDLTELELVTLALAVLSAIISIFWWDKPLGVQVAVPVYLRDIRPVNALSDDELGIFDTLKRASHESLDQFSSFFAGGAKSFVSDFRHRRNHLAIFLFRWFIYLPLHRFVYKPIRKIGKSFFDIIQTETIRHNATHAPTFYAAHINDRKAIIMSLILAWGFLPVFAMFFGGLHCMAWNFVYPSILERTLWRGASLIITAMPVPIFIIYALASYKNWSIHEHLILVMLTVYLVARFFLVVLSLVLLREQPDKAFHAVNWTKFLPRI